MRIMKAVIGVIFIIVGFVAILLGLALCLTVIGIPVGFFVGMGGLAFCGGGLAGVTNQPMFPPKHYIRKAATQLHRPI